MIPREIIEEVTRRTDLVALAGSYIQLKKAGSNWVGLCPFHSENSPSFTVFGGGQEGFYCFGCGAGGDAISFVKRIENLEYPEAVELLAARAGIEIPEDASAARRRGPDRSRIREMNKEAAVFFHSVLMNSPQAAEAREYLAKRKIGTPAIRRFYLGYNPADGYALRDHLASKGYTPEEMTAGFLCGRSQGGRIYDYFRDRVMFPIVDTSRNIVAFGGRVMGDIKPKYLNTSDTPAFNKSKTLFALNYAKDFCSDSLILCEGYMDVISMHQAGFQNAVATLGTAITEEHARIISRYTKKVILSYDSDEAGTAATAKAMKRLGAVGVEVRVLRIEGAKDPDEYIVKYGADSFRRLLEDSLTGFDYRLGKIMSGINPDIPEDRLKAAGEAAKLIAGYGSAVVRDTYVAKAAGLLSVKPDSLASDVARERRRAARRQEREESENAISAAQYLGDRVNPESAGNIRAAAAEDTVLGMMLMYDEYRQAAAGGAVRLTEDDFYTSFGKKIFSLIIGLQKSDGGFSFPVLASELTDDETGRLEGCRVRRAGLENSMGIFESAASVLAGESEAKRRGAEHLSLDEILRRKREGTGFR
ncbi:MAG: DNA primase [Clostridia bacterium]|nr:DNA primase [Clostridia bacterium]